MTTARTRGELTLAQHQFIRRQLTLIPFYIWLAYAWWLTLRDLPLFPGVDRKHLFRDFLHFYTQAAITWAHDTFALYDIDAMAAVAARLSPVQVQARFPPVYPPQIGMLVAPLSLLRYEPALYVWIALTVALTVACAWLVWRTRRSLVTSGWATAVLVLGAPGLHFAMSSAQMSVVALACFTALWLALVGQRPFLAGVAIGALAYKPQLGLAAAVVCVFGGEWRMVAGAATAVAAQALAVVAYWGVAVVPAYIRALRMLPAVVDAMEPDKSVMFSWRSLLQQLGVSASVAVAGSVVLSLGSLAIAVSAWRTRGSLALRYAVLALTTVLVNPHMFGYDLLLLVPALLVAWDWANEQRHTEVLILSVLAYATPLLPAWPKVFPVQWSVLAMAMLSTAIWRQLHKENKRA